MADSKLTVYSKLGHYRRIADDGIAYLPSSVQPQSIVVLTSDGKVVPFMYTNGADVIPNSFDLQPGYEVTVIKKGRNYEGTILQLQGSNIILGQKSGSTLIRDYDSIMVHSDPRIQIVFTSPEPVLVSSLISQLNWFTSGTIWVQIPSTSNQGTLQFRLTGCVTNGTDIPISSNLTLVSGEVYQPPSVMPRRAMAMMAQSQPRPNMSMEKDFLDVSPNPVEDYVEYPIGPKILNPGMNIFELGIASYSAQKIYVHFTNENKVEHGYRWIADRFIPKCEVGVYLRTDGDRYIGSASISESQATEPILILMGASTLVKCTDVIETHESVISDTESATQYGLSYDASISQKWHVTRTDLKIVIQNFQTIPANLILRHNIDTQTIIKMSVIGERKRDYIEWTYIFPPGGQHVFECTIWTASLY